MVRHHTQFDVESKIAHRFVAGFFSEGQVTVRGHTQPHIVQLSWRSSG